MPYFYGFDSYVFLIIPAIIISLWAQLSVKTAFSKYSRIRADLTGAEAARMVLQINGVHNVKIERVSGSLTDHYDPRTNVIRLSDTVYSSPSIAAIGVAAHEAGHAVQYAQAYIPIKLRSAILPVSQIGSQLSMPLLLIGIIFNFSFLMDLGIIFFCAALAFQLITLPVEFNASARAMRAIKQASVLTKESDIKGASRVLRAAAMTYVASVIVSVMQLIRLIAVSGRRKR